VTLRRAAADDAHALAGLNRFVHDTHLARRPDYFKPTGVDEVAAWFTSLLSQPTTVIWIAEEDRLPVGYVVALVSEHAENAFRRARRWCEIDQIAVAPRWRRHGVGTRLLECVLAEAQARGLTEIELSSWAFNDTAHATFRRLGFTPRVIRFERTQP
jgi:ribosomal protein S18 acetylase RimI-like enzyme